MANQFLGLSLFVMLLSFFIILNAISSFEVSKSATVLNSLSLTFSKDKTLEEIMPGKMTIESAQTQQGSMLDKIEAVFKSQIAAAETKQNRFGTIMYVRIPFDDFERGMTSSLTISQKAPNSLSSEVDMDMIPMLVSLMETERSVIYTMDMMRNIEENPATLFDENPETFMQMNKSIASIAAKLEQAGLPRYQVTAGLKQGEPGYVDLIFRRYKPFNPLGVNAVSGEDAESEAQEADG